MDREDLGARLYELRGQAVALARRVLREDAAAEDACAEGYLRALTYPDAVPPPEQLKPWFLRVVLNAAMSRLKSDEARRRREESVMVERRSGRDENASDVAERKEITAVVSEAVQELEEKFRIPIVLRYEHGLSQAEVATVLGDPVGTVASNISRGLEKLRGMLAARGITAAPAVIGGALAEVGKQAGCPAEFGARIKGMIEAHAAREATVGGAAGVPATGAAKGGVMMKVAA
ncbi:MAG: sigma-70 family RNA polymerase sigma factor, partial [Planctomycetota bacterium]|nr:sigma-70 family RNA polymerase sigma factor [Planctomycetota bacterium]